ncbi:transmembrane and coiled coil domains 3, isoform CRA_d [Mus musculus]|nr:transmembrane and coiled coil domains 3, isoform CRA_d [Mus musculus]
MRRNRISSDSSVSLTFPTQCGHGLASMVYLLIFLWTD